MEKLGILIGDTCGWLSKCCPVFAPREVRPLPNLVKAIPPAPKREGPLLATQLSGPALERHNEFLAYTERVRNKLEQPLWVHDSAQDDIQSEAWKKIDQIKKESWENEERLRKRIAREVRQCYTPMTRYVPRTPDTIPYRIHTGYNHPTITLVSGEYKKKY